MTQSTTKQLTFPYYKRRQLTVDFEGGEITSDAGLLQMRNYSHIDIFTYRPYSNKGA